MEKEELIQALEDGQQEMVDLLEGLPDEAMLEPGVIGNWSIKDMLAHLTFWEGQAVAVLFQIQQSDQKPSAAFFGKETTDQVNTRIHEVNNSRPLESIWTDFLGVRKQTIRRVNEVSDDALNNPTRFPWTNGLPLYELVLDNSVSHADEHSEALLNWLEEFDARSAAAEEEDDLSDGKLNGKSSL